MVKLTAPILIGAKISQAELSEAVDTAPKLSFLKQVYLHYLNNNRKVIASVKTRSQVSGSNKKPWKQKGTGRARHGSVYSSLWRGGGVTFGPSPERNFKTKLNQKSKNKALKDIICLCIKNNRLIIIDRLDQGLAKTKSAKLWLARLPIKKGSTMFISVKSQEKPVGFNNLADVYFQSLQSPRFDFIFNSKNLVITKEALGKVIPNAIKSVKSESKK